MQQDSSFAKQTLDSFFQSCLAKRDVEEAMNRLAGDFCGIGIGKQGLARTKAEFRALLEEELRNVSTSLAFRWEISAFKWITKDIVQVLGRLSVGRPLSEENAPFCTIHITALVQRGKDGTGRLCSLHLSVAGAGFQEKTSPQQELQLRKQQHFLSLILENNTVGTMMTYYDRDFTFAYVGDNLISFLGCSREEFERTYQNALQIVFPEDRAFVSRKIRTQLEQQDSYEIEYRLQRCRGEVLWVMEKGNLKKDESGRSVLVSALMDISQRRKEKEQLVLETKVDPLTGVFNRRGTEEEISRKLKNGSQTGCFAFFLLDLDNFKQINDSYGHVAGDKVLCETAALLKDNFRREDVISRLGGDEFSVFVSGLRSVQEAVGRAQSICGLIREHFARRGQYLSVSIGIAPADSPHSNFESLYQAADKALYQAKRAGKNTVCFQENE